MEIKRRNHDVTDPVEAYCVKCKAKRIMRSPKKITMKNGRPARKGTCPECGSGMFRIGG
jgi:Zn finger protein HypA/HybF involved in hydrogenase expression